CCTWHALTGARRSAGPPCTARPRTGLARVVLVLRQPQVLRGARASSPGGQAAPAQHLVLVVAPGGQVSSAADDARRALIAPGGARAVSGADLAVERPSTGSGERQQRPWPAGQQQGVTLRASPVQVHGVVRAQTAA